MKDVSSGNSLIKQLDADNIGEISNHIDNGSDTGMPQFEDNESHDEVFQNSVSQHSKRKSPPKKRQPDAKLARVTCDICGIETRKQHLARHMLRHTGLKPYECDTCPMAFTRKDKLNEHKKKRHGVSAVARYGRSKRHEKTLEGISQAPPQPIIPKTAKSSKQYTCDTCGFTAANRNQYRLHRKENHQAVKKTYR